MAAAYAIGTREARATCRICGQPALPAVRLCAQCKAALKRVRHDTVSQLMPMSRRTRGGARTRREGWRADSPAGEEWHRGVSWRGVRIPVALGAMVAIVGSAGYFIVRQIHAATPADAPMISSTVDAGNARAAQPVAVTAPVMAINVAAGPPPPAPVTDGTAPANAPTAPAKPRSAARSAKGTSAFVGPPAPELPPEPTPAPVVVAAAPAPPAPRPLDPMQLLAQALTQCPQESLLPRMVCEQKARLQYCDGYWGRAPLCPNGAPENNPSH